MNKYKDWDLLDIEGSQVIENIYGPTLKITRRQEIDFSLENKKETVKKDLLSDLKLIPGIGITKEENLKNKGYNTYGHSRRGKQNTGKHLLPRTLHYRSDSFPDHLLDRCFKELAQHYV